MRKYIYVYMYKDKTHGNIALRPVSSGGRLKAYICIHIYNACIYICIFVYVCKDTTIYV